MATDEIAERVKAGFDRARDKLAVARHVLAAGYPADAASPAYYAVFHAAEAVLSSKGTSRAAMKVSRPSSASAS